MSLRLRSLKIGVTLYVYDDVMAPEVEKIAADALKRGITVESPNGDAQWIEVNPVIDTTKIGADVFTWDRSGNRVKCCRTLVTRERSGVVRRVALGFSFRDYEEAVG